MKIFILLNTIKIEEKEIKNITKTKEKEEKLMKLKIYI